MGAPGDNYPGMVGPAGNWLGLVACLLSLPTQLLQPPHIVDVGQASYMMLTFHETHRSCKAFYDLAWKSLLLHSVGQSESQAQSRFKTSGNGRKNTREMCGHLYSSKDAAAEFAPAHHGRLDGQQDTPGPMETGKESLQVRFKSTYFNQGLWESGFGSHGTTFSNPF